MQKNLLQEAERCLAQKRRRRMWRKIVGVLACVVVFCTIYGLTLPAITMEKTICGVTEHIHTDECYISDQEYATDEVHVHTEECRDEDGNLVCQEEFTELAEQKQADFEDGLPTAEEPALVCQLPEHIHTEECYTQTVSDDVDIQEENDVVTEAVVILEGEDAAPAARGNRMMRAPEAESAVGDIASHLTSVQIKINGEPYDGVSALNPGEQFSVSLEWQLNRSDLTDTRIYTYTLPEQIKVKDAEETVLYDESNNRKGVYYITNGVLTVIYDNIADLNKTTFTLNATWNQEVIQHETTVNWNGTLNSHIKFDNSQIAVTKEHMETKTLSDGSLVYEYAVRVNASSSVNNITLTDTLTSDKFHFYRGNYKSGEATYDYRYSITDDDGNKEYQYGNLPGAVTTGSVTFPVPDLQEGQTYTVEYAVCLDADDRFALDQECTAAGLTNTATASYPFGDETLSSTVTVTDTYHADNKWVIKERGKLEAGDVEQKTDIPWTVRVNPDREYALGGAVIADTIQTEGVVYKTDRVFTVTSITDNGSDSSNPRWIQLSDEAVSAIYGVRGQNAIELLYGPEGAKVLAEIEKAVGYKVSKSELSTFVFVNRSRNQFVWFTPQTETPTTYELSYITDASEATSNTLSNSAAAGWKQWTSGVVTGSFLQEVELKKENSGVYIEGEDYLVEWTISLNVPAGRNAIPNVFLYDALPYHSQTDSYDWLVGLKLDQLDYKQFVEDRKTFLNNLKEASKPAFTIATDSSNEQVKEIVNHAAASLGHPVNGLGGDDFKLYDENDTLQGQLGIVNAAGTGFDKRRMTPTRFGIWLGDLPDTLGKDGYTITVKYTTKVNPQLIEGLNGRAYGYNLVTLQQHNNQADVWLAQADAIYWVDHSTVQNTLAKSVADFDSENNIVTYKVNINPDATLGTGSGIVYILKDVLDLPGASFIEKSFQLSFLGTVDPNSSAFTWDGSQETILWKEDDGHVDIEPWQSEVMKDMVSNVVNNPNGGSSDFTFTITNANNVLALKGPETAAGKLAPMVLTYQVKLPEGTGAPTQETITNSVTLSQKSGENDPVLLDGVKTTFDYTTALHKRLSAAPNGDNGYTATFVIDVNKGVEEWKNMGDTFTVSDEMSKTLAVDITSIKVYGIKNDGSEELLTSDYTTAYDDRSSETQNFLSVTIKDSNTYSKYRIEYSTRVQGEVSETVSYDNIAAVQGTEIRSEEIKKDVYIQKQDASVVESNYQVKLLKFDASNTNIKLKATFTLYAYENGEWIKKLEGLKTDENGELVLNNTAYPKLGLGPETWYKLVETEAPAGYIKGTTYFHIGQPGTDEHKPDEVTGYTTIPLKGGIHQIPNYKASLRLHKAAENHPDTYLTGAEFALYSSKECSGEPLATAREQHTGIYTFDLTGLTANTSYYLKETKAPAGYNLADSVYEACFDAEGNVTLKISGQDDSVEKDSRGAYLIENRYGHELPLTGGTGTLLYTFSGIAFMAGALMYDIHRRRRRDIQVS